MSQIKRLLMVDDSIRDMAARLAVTLDVEIEEALRFALVTTHRHHSRQRRLHRRAAPASQRRGGAAPMPGLPPARPPVPLHHPRRGGRKGAQMRAPPAQPPSCATPPVPLLVRAVIRNRGLFSHQTAQFGLIRPYRHHRPYISAKMWVVRTTYPRSVWLIRIIIIIRRADRGLSTRCRQLCPPASTEREND